jgi:hypothetical protein
MRLIVLAIAVALVAACGEAAGGPAETTLVKGSVVLSPASPVCHVGTSCSKPLPRFRLVFVRRGEIVARTKTDARGHYRVKLGPGRYAVRALQRGQLDPSRVRIPASARATVNFKFDAGIR